ncbi:sulfurtransferase/chromate resistance protein [Sphingomonas immobilis]|uniref:Sulfurtransferase/chromate resistance protein n=1 Tax=Sphingomonas immobilis TaxID=3063997 RepID=A0ABT8ZW25_9SPHN|nr:sulfurtransferase/chromate resistance protein [Sphingomonas sp. CA1-15]MDO7841771.1 sulfurtransferase/chromate resistance protein [Sphingomonas sp. CA1-15]
MPASNQIAPDKLARLIGLPGSPTIIDVRAHPEQAVPGSILRDVASPLTWAREINGGVVIVDSDGSAGASIATVLRSDGLAVEALEGGFSASRAGSHLTASLGALPPRHDDGRTWWVTRARPKVDRIACPWLIRRFVDPAARFLFVAPVEVLTVATQQHAEPFDIPDDRVRWSHRGELCTFDVMLEAFGLSDHASPAHLATIVRGADTDRLEVAPEAAGLLAISLGLSRTYSDDYAQLEAGMLVYDALYRWCRDARDEKHDWTSHTPTRAKTAA